MIESTLGEIARWIGGTVHDADPDTPVRAPATHDSRSVTPGGLYVAIAGERVDGHDFAAAAVAAGAVGCLVARPVGVPAIVVDDPTAALGRLASAVLDRLPRCTVIGLTGSQGKTTTKDLLAQVLTPHGRTVAPAGSYNTEIGLPLTVLRADPDTRYLVLEMGARGRGHIAYLCGLTRPRVGLVLNVGLAHVGEFGSREDIAVAKGELVEALPADGLAVLNADDPLVAAMTTRTTASVSRFGAAADAEVRVRDVRVDADGRPEFRLAYAGSEATVRLRLLGRHQVANAAAAAAVALGLGVELDVIAAALSEATATSRWRMELRRRSDGVTILNDAYNANPDSMRAALDSLAELARSRPDSRAIAVLGVMRELGPDADDAHRQVGALAAESGVRRLIAVGADADQIRQGARDAGLDDATLVVDTDAAVESLEDALRPGDIVLVKASRAEQLERVAQALLASDRDTASETAVSPIEGEGSANAR